MRQETLGRADVVVQVQRPSDSRHMKEIMFHSSPKSIKLENSLFLVSVESFVLATPVDGVRPTHTMEDSLLFSKSTELNVNLIQKHPHRHI